VAPLVGVKRSHRDFISIRIMGRSIAEVLRNITLQHTHIRRSGTGIRLLLGDGWTGTLENTLELGTAIQIGYGLPVLGTTAVRWSLNVVNSHPPV
jgi:hypothetical protein